MKNIHVLPTDKPSRLFVSSRDGKIKLTGHTKDFVGIKQHIYITSDEEIKEGDWMYYKHFGEDIVTKYNTWGGQNTNVNEHKDYYKKIILTTDQDLIADGLQAIDDTFLEWFVKNPSCEEVEIGEGVRYEDEWIDNEDGGEIFQHQYCSYKIIIPKEESKQTVQEYEQQGLEKYSYELEPKQDFYKIGDFDKNCDDGCKYHCTKGNTQLAECLKEPKQETLEEAAEKNCESVMYPYKNREKAMFKKGAKWQQERSYSEEEVLELLKKSHFVEQNIEEWFEQFKKNK